jgi:hypothetical protein
VEDVYEIPEEDFDRLLKARQAMQKLLGLAHCAVPDGDGR